MENELPTREGEYEDVLVRVEQGLGVISFNRPAIGNAVRVTTMRELCQALDVLTEDASVRAIVLRAEGKHFSAGADMAFLDALSEMSAPEIRSQIYAHFQGAARRLYACPKPTLALVGGAAVTVGCELALACDFRIAAEDAKFQESWVKLGILPPLGGLFLLPLLIGLGRASSMVLTGRAVGAQEALAIGLVGEVVTREELDARGKQFGLELAAASPLAYALIKDALHRGLESSMASEWGANLQSQAMLLKTQDHAEGLAAVKERRAPSFRGT